MRGGTWQIRLVQHQGGHGPGQNGTESIEGLSLLDQLALLVLWRLHTGVAVDRQEVGDERHLLVTGAAHRPAHAHEDWHHVLAQCVCKKGIEKMRVCKSESCELFRLMISSASVRVCKE